MIEEFRLYAFPHIGMETFAAMWTWLYVTLGLTLGIVVALAFNQLFPGEPIVLLSVPIGMLWPVTLIPCVVVAIVYLVMYLFKGRNKVG